MTKRAKIEINFPVLVDFPPGFEMALDGLVTMVCEQYQQSNKDRVMWTASAGDKITSMFSDPPSFNDRIYCIDVDERKDLHGNNPFNPKRNELRKIARENKTTK